MTIMHLRPARLLALPAIALATLVAACGDDGAAAEPECTIAADCAAPGPETCLVAACASGTCGTAPADAATACPAGVCNGAGSCVECLGDSDCATDVCVANACYPASCRNMVKDGSETDVDCGGSTCPDCAQGKVCLTGGDCLSGVCTPGIPTGACGP